MILIILLLIFLNNKIIFTNKSSGCINSYTKSKNEYDYLTNLYLYYFYYKGEDIKIFF